MGGGSKYLPSFRLTNHHRQPTRCRKDLTLKGFLIFPLLVSGEAAIAQVGDNVFRNA